MKAYIGIELGIKNIKAIVMDNSSNIIYKNSIINTNTINNIKLLFKDINKNISKYKIYNIGLTGDNRFIIGKLLGTNIIKNEIECIYEYAISKKIEGNILDVSYNHNKIINVKNRELVDYKIYNSSNIINEGFINKISSTLNINIDNITIDKYYQFKNDNLLLLQEEIENSNISKEDIISSLIIKLFKSFNFNYLIGDLSINKNILKYLNIEYNVDNYYAKSIGAAIIAKNSESKKTYDLNIENNTIERRINKCHKCPLSCEIVSIYRNHELIDYFGNSCDKGKTNEFTNYTFS